MSFKVRFEVSFFIFKSKQTFFYFIRKFTVYLGSFMDFNSQRWPFGGLGWPWGQIYIAYNLPLVSMDICEKFRSFLSFPHCFPHSFLFFPILSPLFFPILSPIIFPNFVPVVLSHPSPSVLFPVGLIPVGLFPVGLFPVVPPDLFQPFLSYSYFI